MNAPRRVSWGAVFGGSVMALVTFMLLSLLGFAIALWSFNPAEDPNPFSGLGTGTGIWYSVTVIIALFVGGLVAGRLPGIPRRIDSMIQGLLTWGVVSIVGVWFVVTASVAITTGALALVGSTIGVVGQEVAGAIGDVTGDIDVNQDALAQQVRQYLQATGNPDLQPQALEQELQEAGETVTGAGEELATQPGQAGVIVQQALQDLVAQGGEMVSDVGREDAVNALTSETNLTRPEAEEVVDNWISTWQQVRTEVVATAEGIGATARQVSTEATNTLGWVSFWSFIALLLGGVAAALGGMVAAPRSASPSTASSDTNRPIVEH